MAKAKSTATREDSRIPMAVLRRMDELAVRLSLVRGTAKCVQRALWNQGGRDTQEISILVREHIFQELDRLHDQLRDIMTELDDRWPLIALDKQS